MGLFSIAILFVLFLVIIWCLRQLEGVSEHIKDNPFTFFVSALFMINLVYTPLWIGAIDGRNYYSVILLNMVFVPLIFIISYGKSYVLNIFKKYLNNERKHNDDEWFERKPGDTDNTEDNESINKEDSGNVESDDGRSVCDEGGNTESASEQYSFSETKKNKGLKHKNQSELSEKSSEKDTKRIDFNQINSVEAHKNIETETKRKK